MEEQQHAKAELDSPTTCCMAELSLALRQETQRPAASPESRFRD